MAALLVIVLSGCASQRVPALPTATVPPREAVLALPAILAEPQRWSGQRIVLIAPVQKGPAARVLTIAPVDARLPSSAPPGIWLAQPLPDAITGEAERGPAAVRLRGTLSPPGAYGSDQQFVYQFSAESAELLRPERTTLANLVENPGALDRILLRLDGTLLVQRESALLVDQVSPGGVPTAAGRQLKLARAAIDQGTIEQLNRSGEVRWGPVQIVGWWQDRALTLFSISPASDAAPSPR